MQTQTIDLDGPVHYLEYGSGGPTFVCVHGLGGSHANWVAAAPLMARTGRVLVLDLAGFGRTPPAGRSTSVQANQRLLGRFLDEMVGGPAILAGNSMGGMISLFEASQHPERVAGLVLIGPAVPRPRTAPVDPLVLGNFLAYVLPGVGERFLRRRRARLGPEGMVRETLRLVCADPSRVSGEVVAEALDLARERARMPWVDDAFLEAARSLVRVLASPRTYRERISAVTAPTLLVQGVADRLTPVAGIEAVAKSRPDWTLTVLEGVGHVPMLETPEEFTRRVEAWLDGPGREALTAASMT